MKSQILSWAAALTLSCAFAAQAQDRPGNVAPQPGSRSEAMSATKDKMGHMAGMVSAEVTGTTKGFVAATAASDMYELAAADIALDRSHNRDVKSLARAMKAAHSKTTAELKDIVASENIDATLPTELDMRRQSLINDLRGVKEVDFDKRYVSQQIDAHNEALILMRGYHDSGDNKALKKFAGNVENAVKMHLGMATRLQKTLEAQEQRADNR
jgi:putative membrane protein